MINHRQLIKEIPAGKFHSALMTSYSINLYYWDIQLLPSLSSKGINYVSALVDSDCLSGQLLNFSRAFDGEKPLDFSLHGYKTGGAFHPKIQFYVGEESVLVLIGSGNLTVMGHGRNLEVWSPIMVDKTDSPAYPFMRDVWNYLKSLYHELGTEANKIINLIESNCSLLSEKYDKPITEHPIDGNSIRFFANVPTKSLFDQCKEWIGDDDIQSITIMSPFYDKEAKLIKAMHEQFGPSTMQLIVEDDFGALPNTESIPENVKIYKWDKKLVPSQNKYQCFFHSKCFFFEGKRYHYLLCGSANASVAAFGYSDIKPQNEEACVGFKSENINYLNETGFHLNDPINREELSQTNQSESTRTKNTIVLWIKEASYLYNNFSITIENNADPLQVTISFFSGNRNLLSSSTVQIQSNTSIVSGSLNGAKNPLYVEISNDNGDIISNRQFMISIEGVDVNNPSPESVLIRRKLREIESGKFVSGDLLKFINQVLIASEPPKKGKSSSEKISQKTPDVEEGNSFNSLEEYFKEDGDEITGYRDSRRGEKTAYQSTMLFDSIISYISKSAQEKEEDKMNNEELEDYRRSEGCDTKKTQATESKTEKNSQETQTRVIKMFDKYISQLECVVFPAKNEEKGKVKKSKNVPPTLLDSLKKFMTAIFFLYRTFSYRYTIESGDSTEHSLIELSMSSSNHKTATEYVFRLTSLFALYLKKLQLKTEENIVLKKKIESYKQYSFELCLAVFSICDWLNEGIEDYKEWCTKYKAASLLNIKKLLGATVEHNAAADVFRRLDRAIQELDGFDESTIQRYIQENISMLTDEALIYPRGHIHWTDQFGYIYLKPYNSNMSLLCTMACDYDFKRGDFCPDYCFLEPQKTVFRFKESKSPKNGTFIVPKYGKK